MTFDPVGLEHQALRQGIGPARRQAHREWGALAATYENAMRLWDAQKAHGLSFSQRLTGLDQTLRIAWLQGRGADWKYLCSRCSDYGFEMHDCPGDATCGRPKAHLPHDYGTPCWCDAGKRFRDKPKRSHEDYADAGKTQPSKLGRR